LEHGPGATRTRDLLLRRQALYPAELRTRIQGGENSPRSTVSATGPRGYWKTGRAAHQGGSSRSGRPDLNRGPPAPEAGALTGLRYAPWFTRRVNVIGRPPIASPALLSPAAPPDTLNPVPHLSFSPVGRAVIGLGLVLAALARAVLSHWASATRRLPSPDRLRSGVR
jgi:hypothetical protein